MSTMISEPDPDMSLEETILAHAERLEWLLRPICRSGANALPVGGLVFHKFQSMNQTWSRAGA
ncbi:hypothetical protein [Streptomyces sp. NBC_01481]|uniref:hypothetical protein n=1 Tax=Streptomyces sp. NBC_01481 TaxID=2975869 RepID=UPI002252CA7C|nr:hypothetical protein [Streptomyces sp. NBC_01481]MCX4587456.1 hypothetical protein [Streptomyces sp. NBC_01481]